MDEWEDLKKLNAVIQKHKVEIEDSDETEFYETEYDISDYDDNTNDSDDLFEIGEYKIPTFSKPDITKFNVYAPSEVLTENEKRIVDSCTDPILKELLLLNRRKNFQLMELYSQIKDLFVECQANIEVCEREDKNVKHSKKMYSRIWRLGIPYFKTADNFPCPRNADIVRKHNNGELFFYDETPTTRWTPCAKNRLLRGVAFQYKTNRETELREVNTSNGDKSDDTEDCQVISYPEINCEKYINWHKLSKMCFNERFSLDDCRIFWRTYLHPSVNKGPWTGKENEKLMSLVSSYRDQNWDQIAKELGNHRTGFVTCVHYYRELHPRRGGRFTPEEDRKLCDLVEKYKLGKYVSWPQIAHHFSGKTRAQLHYRYKYFLSCKGYINTGKFSDAEDVLLMVLVDRFGKKYSKCEEYFPTRSALQIKARYTTNLGRAIKKGSFSIEEDRQILDFVETNGTGNWGPLVKILSRCGGQIRQRYNTLIAFRKAYPDAPLEKAPRRRFVYTSVEKEYDYLRLIADGFQNKNKLPTLEDIEAVLKSNQKPNSTHLMPLRNVKNLSGQQQRESTKSIGSLKLHNKRKQPGNGIGECTKILVDASSTTCRPSFSVDDLITDFLSNTMKLDFEKNIREKYIRDAANAVNSMLFSLQAELCIPKDYNLDPRLDTIDIAIIKVLTAAKPMTSNGGYVMKRNSFCIEQMVPPNLNTVVCMRNLLVKNQMYNDKSARKTHVLKAFKKELDKQILWCINAHLSSQLEDVQNEMVIERNLFFKRFVSIFKFPAIMTLVEPSRLLQSTAHKGGTDASNRVRTYQKKAKVNQILVGTKPNNTESFEVVLVKESTEEKSEIKPQEDPLDRSYHSSEIAISQPSTSKNNSLDEVRMNTTDGKQGKKLSIADQLKRKINATIQELTKFPSAKKFFHQCPEFVTERKPSEVSNELRVVESKNSQPVAKHRVSKSKMKNVKKNKVYGKAMKKKVARHSEQAKLRKHVSTAKIIDTGTTTNSKMQTKTQTSSIANKNKNSFNSRVKHSQNNFDFGKGELILENFSDITVPTNQELHDIELLDDILEKEKNTIEECFDF